MGRTKKAASKKTRRAAPRRQPCVSCKNLVLESQTTACPGCERLFCIVCSEFVSCSSDKCNNPALCSDCAFGVMFDRRSKANRERRKRGEPIDTSKCAYPMLMCGNDECNELLCFDCASWETAGQDGHEECTKCGKNRCLDCSLFGDVENDLISCCDTCNMTYCFQCDPDFVFEPPETMCCSECYDGEKKQPAKPSKKQCGNPNCKNDKGSKTMKCGGCQSVRYCSKECQATMWRKHKAECKKRQEILKSKSSKSAKSKSGSILAPGRKQRVSL